MLQELDRGMCMGRRLFLSVVLLVDCASCLVIERLRNDIADRGVVVLCDVAVRCRRGLAAEPVSGDPGVGESGGCAEIGRAHV